MSKLDKGRAELELIQVHAARKALEFRIDELMEDVERIKTHIEIQIKKEEEIKTKLQNM